MLEPPVLSVRGLTRRHGGVRALDGVDLDVPARGIHALIGPNGAGKTTLFDCLSGITAPSSGRILLAGADVTRAPPHLRARAGLSRTFQAIRLFGPMSVLETVLVGVRGRSGEAAALATARASIARCGLEGRERAVASAFSYGDQRRVEVARALAAAPRLLLLDEPASGLNPVETAALGALLRGIAADGVAVLLVEHDMRFVMGLADTVTVLSFGRVLFHGSPSAARRDKAVVEAYLGHRLAQTLSA